MSRPVRGRLAATLAATTASSAVLAVLAPAAQATPRELDLTFESTSLRANAGTSALAVNTVTVNGGTITKVTGANGAGSGARLPRYAASNAGFAVLTATDKGANVLSPGSRKFVFGADFTLDATSEGNKRDNGNNLIQRGLFKSAMQYKIQVDGRKPFCRVKGSGGTVTVQSSRAVEPGAWYRARCTRDGSTVTLKIVRLADKTSWTYTKSGSTGSLTASASVPLSVGGKVDNGGSIVTSATDQFNGQVDNAIYNVV